MRPVRRLAIIDLDGVLVDLHPDRARLRGQIEHVLAEEGASLDSGDWAMAIQAASAQAEVRQPGAGAPLAARLWKLVDEEEARQASLCRVRPGARELLDRLAGVPLVLCASVHREAVTTALGRAGIDRARFASIHGRIGAAPCDFGAVLDATHEGTRLFVVTHDPGAWSAARAALGPEVVVLGNAHDMDEVAPLESAGADFVMTELGEAAPLITTPPSSIGLTMVLLALNEEASIAAAVRDCRRMARLWLADYEILVIDDGSTDGTSAAAEAASQGDVRVIHHARNLGMGAGMRDGYGAARCPYITHLPADRQVRPQSLVAFLPRLNPETTVISSYTIPHSGESRRWLSLAFRLILRGVGGLHVDYAGSYIFHRHWLERVPLDSVRSETFVFSFELLERLRRAGSRFARVPMRPFAREVGQSREVALRRMARVFAEVARHRKRAWMG